jgi:hypothetical protein
VRHAVARFHTAYEETVTTWARQLKEIRADGARIAIWGAGTKGVMFLNTLGVTPDVVSCAVDVNPRKQGRFVAGTGQEIVAPEALRQIQPDVILVMNPLYADEIKTTLANLKLSPAVVTV